jgi:hypothetical protein
VRGDADENDGAVSHLSRLGPPKKGAAARLKSSKTRIGSLRGSPTVCGLEGMGGILAQPPGAGKGCGPAGRGVEVHDEGRR